MEIVEKFEKILSDFNAKPIDYAHPTSMDSLDFTQIPETEISEEMEEELKKFFYNNGERLDAFIWQYEKFGRKIRREREKKLYEYLEKVRKKTGEDAWRIYQDWDLCISFNDKKRKARIGIESRFRGGTYKNQLGNFCIYITVWEKKDFFEYENKLKTAFPEGVKNDESWGVNRIVLRVAEISANKTDKIIKELEMTYNTMKGIINSKDA